MAKEIASRKEKQLQIEYRLFIEEISDGAAIFEDDGTIIYFNNKFINLLALQHEEFTYTSSNQLSIGKDGLNLNELLMLGKEIRCEKEVSFVSAQGDTRYLNLSIFPLYSGESMHTCLIIKDITEIKAYEKSRMIAKEKAEESDRLNSTFLANMSHEIRTPMNGILGFADLLKEPLLSGEEQQEYIAMIEKSGARMLNIINDIIEISKIESGQMKVDIRESNVNEQLEYLYNFFQSECELKGIKLIINKALPSNLSIIKTDREKVFTILTNLIKNAIKYSKNGTIEFGYILVETMHASSLPHAAALLEFYVKDHGIGIPEERHKAIFERFIQADIADRNAWQGAGLGLAIAKSYVEMLGGKFRVESEEGKGSGFYFTLPYLNNYEVCNSNVC